MVLTTVGWRSRAVAHRLPWREVTNPTSLGPGIRSRTRRSSIARSRSSKALVAEYVMQGAPKTSSITNVKRPSSETSRFKSLDNGEIPEIPNNQTPSDDRNLQVSRFHSHGAHSLNVLRASFRIADGTVVLKRLLVLPGTRIVALLVKHDQAFPYCVKREKVPLSHYAIVGGVVTVITFLKRNPVTSIVFEA
jgi:hypothetical protein